MKYLACDVPDGILDGIEKHPMSKMDFFSYLRKETLLKLNSDDDFMDKNGNYFYHFLSNNGINLSNIKLLHEKIFQRQQMPTNWREIVLVSYDAETNQYQFFRCINKISSVVADKCCA